ncbi:hypothetical protein [Stigmatella aurantiaca]|uniref:hypothetical protein n=1 Tax=Stigmatella aurantiaca TaxID=41 RepID=UPI001E5B95B9|nr:hypothetical protein [Stigmatella aurantiaca]
MLHGAQQLQVALHRRLQRARTPDERGEVLGGQQDLQRLAAREPVHGAQAGRQPVELPTKHFSRHRLLALGHGHPLAEDRQVLLQRLHALARQAHHLLQQLHPFQDGDPL